MLIACNIKHVPRITFAIEFMVQKQLLMLISSHSGLFSTPGPSVHEVQRSVVSGGSSSQQPGRTEDSDVHQLVHESGP